MKIKLETKIRVAKIEFEIEIREIIKFEIKPISTTKGK
jgi:hypothetical protein